MRLKDYPRSSLTLFAGLVLAILSVSVVGVTAFYLMRWHFRSPPLTGVRPR